MIKIKRTRGFYLYTEEGKRLVDFSLGNGTAILGHKPHKLISSMKRALDKGYAGTLFTQETERLQKHIPNYLIGWKLVAVLNSSATTLSQHHFITQNGISNIVDCTLQSSEQSIETIMNSVSSQDCILWRPFSLVDTAQIALFLLQSGMSQNFLITPAPFEWGEGIMLVCSCGKDGQIVNPYVEVSSVLLAGLNYILPYLISKGLAFRPIFTESKNRNDIFVLDDTPINSKYKHKKLVLPSTWNKQGIYIILPQYTQEEYVQIARCFLDAGFYFPEIASQQVPRILIMPAYFTKYEFEQWDIAIKNAKI